MIVFASAMAVIVVAEMCARALSPYLPAPRLWADETTAAKVAQMDSRGGSCTDLVLAGDSMGRDAFVPATFTQADPNHRSAYNASLDAASPGLLSRWIQEEVLGRLHPATVVLALASLDVNTNSRAIGSMRTNYEAAPLSRAGAWGDVEAWAVNSSALLRHRVELRQPSVLWDSFARARDGEAAPRRDAAGLIGTDGEGLTRRNITYSGGSATRAFLDDQLLNDFVLDQDGLRVEGELMDALGSRGISVALVILPVTDDYANSHAGAFSAFMDSVNRLATDHQTPLIDLHDRAEPSSFADTHHLNASGAGWFSRSLASELDSRHVIARRC